jgi:hypothetical protein
MKVYNAGAQVERKIGVIKVTDSDTLNTPLHTLACIEFLLDKFRYVYPCFILFASIYLGGMNTPVITY